MKEKKLSEEQIFLLNYVAQDSVTAWSSKTDTSDLIKQRVLLRKLIRSDLSENWDLVAEYYSVKLPSKQVKKSKDGTNFELGPDLKGNIFPIQVKVEKIDV